MLDENLFSLTVTAAQHGGIAFHENARAGSSEEPLYIARPVPDAGETVTLEEPLSGSVLARTRTVTKKLRLVELENPPVTIECKATGHLSWEHTFVYEGHRFEWKRDLVMGAPGDQRGFTLSMVRKPDPDWQICVYRPATSKPAVVQILDYQLKRVDIEDAKGLEIVILATLASFLDLGVFSPSAIPAARPSPPPKQPVAGPSIIAHPPPRQPKTPEIVEQTEPNDFAISESIPEDLYVQGCLGVLEDRSLAFITIRARNADLVPKAVRIAAEVKTRRLKESGEELHQYVKDDQPANIPHISLGKSGAYAPPAALQSIRIFLSREPLAELQPRPPPRLSPSPQPPPMPGKGAKLQKPAGSSGRTSWFSGVRPRDASA